MGLERVLTNLISESFPMMKYGVDFWWQYGLRVKGEQNAEAIKQFLVDLDEVHAEQPQMIPQDDHWLIMLD